MCVVCVGEPLTGVYELITNVSIGMFVLIIMMYERMTDKYKVNV